MSYPALNAYLERLATGEAPSSSLRLSGDGEVQGHIFNCWLGSAFHPIRELGSGEISGYAGRVRGVAEEDRGLPIWTYLDGAASDDESVALDRLCRTLHAINFFRNAGQGAHTLHLNVHDRLLSAVSSNHGMAFRRILDSLGLPLDRIVLQLPAVNARQNWMLNYVADNYRRNGFRISVKVATALQLPSVFGHARVDSVRIASLHGATAADLTNVLAQAAALNVDILVKDDTPALREAAARTGAQVRLQENAGRSVDRLAA
ncbi:EAL domain, c-di-GMP-specific phosphodiesterase class I (or its enzymatically inactive variant) [Duganella sp. CF458]|uniref:EAL domain-containing protein n=1 Tax=Duganella sp. CF458 TaxID=1884368 RepID=UPI0008E05105|nr:EAL domain-containing protein [Duganella sp. CF458]SFG87534.1 EAL domain, c-di-GMP-specific phosphodiesterase class I (or its enzymatically inactive variant) [Duganella sp. CF458]